MNNKVLMIDDDRMVRSVVKDFLTGEGFEVITARNSLEAEKILSRELPDLILLDVVMPDINGFDFLRQLRNNTRTSHLPVLMLSSRAQIQDKIQGLDLGADDYITKPFEPMELLARVKTNIRRAKQVNLFNPLTGLPGNKLIEEKMEALLQKNAPFSICYVDMDHFKAYNDVYGFIRGDEIIMLLADIIRQEVGLWGNPDDFVGHIGGDDYVIFTSPDKVEPICQEIISRFDEAIPACYDSEHREAGYITALDRHGGIRNFNLITLSIAVVDCEKEIFADPVELAEIAALTKKMAKEIPNSNLLRYMGE